MLFRSASNQGTVNGISGNVDINFSFKDLSGKLPANRWRLIGDKWYYYKNYVKQTGCIQPVISFPSLLK